MLAIVTVIDMTVAKRPPAKVRLEGKLSQQMLRDKAVQALGLNNFLINTYRIEVKDEKGKPTKRITGKCVIFVFATSNSPDISFGAADPFSIFLGNFGVRRPK